MAELSRYSAAEIAQILALGVYSTRAELESSWVTNTWIDRALAETSLSAGSMEFIGSNITAETAAALAAGDSEGAWLDSGGIGSGVGMLFDWAQDTAEDVTGLKDPFGDLSKTLKMVLYLVAGLAGLFVVASIIGAGRGR